MVEAGQNDSLVDKEGATPITVKPGHELPGPQQYLIQTGGECLAIPSPDTSQVEDSFPSHSPKQPVPRICSCSSRSFNYLWLNWSDCSCVQLQIFWGTFKGSSLPGPDLFYLLWPSRPPFRPRKHPGVFFALLLFSHSLLYLDCPRVPTFFISWNPVHPQSLDLNALSFLMLP